MKNPVTAAASRICSWTKRASRSASTAEANRSVRMGNSGHKLLFLPRMMGPKLPDTLLHRYGIIRTDSWRGSMFLTRERAAGHMVVNHAEGFSTTYPNTGLGGTRRAGVRRSLSLMETVRCVDCFAITCLLHSTCIRLSSREDPQTLFKQYIAKQQ